MFLNSPMVRIMALTVALCFCHVRYLVPAPFHQEPEHIRIGFLIPDKGSVSAKNGAELAILKANEKTGRKGSQFHLVVRTMEGPWGAGADEAVKLIFDDKVCALVTSGDGRNAHLVEQAATKSEMVCLSVWSGDPTLSQAFVPWFFNVVPNYNQQAEALTAEIFDKRKFTGAIAIVDKTYDSGSAFKAFSGKMKQKGMENPEQFIYTDSQQDLHVLAGKLQKTKTLALVLFISFPAAVKIIDYLKKNNLNRGAFASLMVSDENEIPQNDYTPVENVIFLSSEHWYLAEARSFTEEFRKKYGYPPGNVAAYAYDGIRVLTEAMLKAGTEREKIQNALTEISFSGVTGKFQFDSKGNRTGKIALTGVKNGIPVKVE